MCIMFYRLNCHIEVSFVPLYVSCQLSVLPSACLVRPLARPFSASGMPCLACLRNVLIINALQKAMF